MRDPLTRKGSFFSSKGIFVVSFAFSKVAVFVLPVLVAIAAAPSVYGAYEFAYSVGMIAFAASLAVTSSGAFHRAMKASSPAEKFGEAASAHLIASSFVLLALLATALFRFSIEAIFAVSVFALIICQNSVSSLMRTLNKPAIASWADGSATISFCTMLLIAAFFSSNPLLYSSIVAIAIWFCSFVFCVVRFPALGMLNFEHVKALLRVGGWMALVGVINAWMVGFGRVIAELSGSGLAEYSLLYRLLGAGLLLHQSISLLFLAKIYGGDDRSFSEFFSKYIVAFGGVQLILALFAFFDPLGLSRFFPGLDQELIPDLVWPIGMLIFWNSIFSWLQLRVASQQKSKQVFLYQVVIVLFSTLVQIALVQYLSLDISSLSWMIVITASLLVVPMHRVLFTSPGDRSIVGILLLGSVYSSCLIGLVAIIA